MTGADGSRIWTVLEVLGATAKVFETAKVGSPRLDAELLLAHSLGIERIQLYVQYDRPLLPAERAAYRELVKRRANGEPVQYLLGTRDFWTLTFEVAPGVLIPRPDTETLVQVVLDELSRLDGAGHAADAGRSDAHDGVLASVTPAETEEAELADVADAAPVADADEDKNPRGTGQRVADVGTGSGCVAVTLAHERPGLEVWAGDIAATPLALAPRNAARAGVSDRVRVLEANGLGPLWQAAGRRPFHVVASNPPYLRRDELAGLMREVRDHEPQVALVAGDDGLDVIRPLIRAAAAPGVLVDGGALAIEVSSTGEQAARVQELMEAAGFADARVVADLAGLPRVVVARRHNR